MGWLKKAFKEVSKPIDKIFDEANNAMDHIMGNDRKKNFQEGRPESGFYVGYNSNSGWSGNINYGGQTVSGGTKPKSYKANVAGTASTIAQGGMTKAELDHWNARHPNEVAGG